MRQSLSRGCIPLSHREAAVTACCPSPSGLPYPALYFLHGLPAAPYAYKGIGFLAKALDAAGRPAILVAPQGARDGDSDAEYLDWGPGRNWETAVSQGLPAYVDAHYRTIADRRGRALVGLSAGGYGAVLLTIHHLDAFSVVESWSGYFHPTDPTGTSPLDTGSPDGNTRSSAHSGGAMPASAPRTSCSTRS